MMRIMRIMIRLLGWLWWGCWGGVWTCCWGGFCWFVPSFSYPPFPFHSYQHSLQSHCLSCDLSSILFFIIIQISFYQSIILNLGLILNRMFLACLCSRFIMLWMGCFLCRCRFWRGRFIGVFVCCLVVVMFVCFVVICLVVMLVCLVVVLSYHSAPLLSFSKEQASHTKTQYSVKYSNTSTSSTALNY